MLASPFFASLGKSCKQYFLSLPLRLREVSVVTYVSERVMRLDAEMRYLVRSGRSGT